MSQVRYQILVRRLAAGDWKHENAPKVPAYSKFLHALSKCALQSHTISDSQGERWRVHDDWTRLRGVSSCFRCCKYVYQRQQLGRYQLQRQEGCNGHSTRFQCRCDHVPAVLEPCTGHTAWTGAHLEDAESKRAVRLVDRKRDEDQLLAHTLHTASHK